MVHGHDTLAIGCRRRNPLCATEKGLGLVGLVVGGSDGDGYATLKWF